MNIKLINNPVIGFINQTIGHSHDQSSFCGVGIRGKLTSEILTNNASDKYTFVTKNIDNNIDDLETFIIKNNPIIIIYNYHEITTPYLNNTYIRNKYSKIIHVIVHYDITQYNIDNFNSNLFNGYNYIITDNEVLKINDNNHFFKVTRSIPYSKNITKYKEREDMIPIIGFQGFGFPHKGIHKMAIKVQEEFDEAIIRLHIPYSYYGDPFGYQSKQRIAEVQNIIRKPGIKIEYTHDFLSDDQIIDLLNSNTINCYFYDYMNGAGIASSPDYAIASFRPIAINNSTMFLNLQNLNPPIEIEKQSLKEIIKNGITPLLPIYEKYTHNNVLKDYENICDKLLLMNSYYYLNFRG